MSEYLLESGKDGVVAAVAYNPCGVSSTSQLLYKEFLDNLFRRGEHCLGRAVFAAKCSVIARYPGDDNLYGPAVLWTLFGDPALRVKHRTLSGVDESFKLQAASRKLSVAPNPCHARAAVRLAGSSFIPQSSSLSVYDASGRLVLSQSVRSSSFILQMSPLPSGVYVVELCSSRCTPLRQKLVVR